MIEEIWRSVDGYEGLYEVSNTGLVRRKKTGRILRPGLSVGYPQVNLCKNGKIKKCKIHRLVAQVFIPNPDGLPQVNHKDENKTNNNVDNLEWCTAKYNINYGTAKERHKNAMINNGHWMGVKKKYNQDKEKRREYNKKYYMMNKDKWKIYKIRNGGYDLE